MVFNRFKTAKTYGEQKVNIPTALKSILNKWIKINPTDYLFFDSNMNPLSSVKITQRLNKIFGKKVGSSMLRHIFLTDKYGDLKEEQQTLASAMGHSVHEQQNVYVKT
jgi:integrase